MIPRFLPTPAPPPPLPSSSTVPPPPLPGLLPSLRPLKRISSQLLTETLLLRRFTYKNKNQHKGCGWWRKVVEVDRVMSRLGEEMKGVLVTFGVEMDKDDIGSIAQSTLVPGLLRLPRAMLLVEKTISILLNCASILDQLIDSRAFLSFALVVVSLVSRLHALATVLLVDMVKASSVLLKLVRTNGLSSQLDKPLSKLPRSLQQFIILDPSTPSTSASAAISLDSSRMPTPRDSPLPPPISQPFPAFAPVPAPSARATTPDDFGAIVSREELLRRKKEKKSSSTTLPFSSSSTPVPPPTILSQKSEEEEPVRQIKKSKKVVASEQSTAPGEAEMMMLKKKKKRKEEGSGLEGEVVLKKKKKIKKKREGGDEIDDIFG